MMSRMDGLKKMELMMDDRWLSVDEIGDYLGVKRDTVYKWISERGMPAHKIGRLWKFKKDEVDGWVRKGGADSSNESSNRK
jgi:excisionase family DNA binding protein